MLRYLELLVFYFHCKQYVVVLKHSKINEVLNNEVTLRKNMYYNVSSIRKIAEVVSRHAIGCDLGAPFDVLHLVMPQCYAIQSTKYKGRDKLYISNPASFRTLLKQHTKSFFNCRFLLSSIYMLLLSGLCVNVYIIELHKK